MRKNGSCSVELIVKKTDHVQFELPINQSGDD